MGSTAKAVMVVHYLLSSSLARVCCFMSECKFLSAISLDGLATVKTLVLGITELTAHTNCIDLIARGIHPFTQKPNGYLSLKSVLLKWINAQKFTRRLFRLVVTCLISKQIR